MQLATSSATILHTHTNSGGDLVPVAAGLICSRIDLVAKRHHLRMSKSNHHIVIEDAIMSWILTVANPDNKAPGEQ